ncbi:hypothetical protein N2152v2_006701 [Parachlorella kessleri]
MGSSTCRPALLLLCNLVGLALVAAGVKEEAPFDLFLLVRQYSPGYCQTTKCDRRAPPVSAFTLHGLWPEFDDGSFPQNCETTQDPGPPPPKSAEMHCKWESFKDPDPEFWDHEWVRHGTCAEPVLGNRPAYFNTTLDLDDKYDLDEAMAAAGITPSDSRTYAAKDVLNAVSDSFGAKPLLKCKSELLVEIWMCLSLDLKPIPCPPGVAVKPQSRCGKEVKLPEGEPVAAACGKFFPPPGQASKRADLVQGAGSGIATAAA